MVDPQGSGPPRDENGLRIRLYELLHERAEHERRWQFRRLAAGHLVVGVILAYAFVFGTWRFVALTPILYGIVVLDGLRSAVRMLYLQQQLVEVEVELADTEPLFEWVTRYGLFGEGRRIEVWDVDLNIIPETAQYVLILSIYLGLIVAALMTWTPLGADSVVGGGISGSLLVVAYATFTVLLGAIILVSYLHYRRVSDRIASIAGDTPSS